MAFWGRSERLQITHILSTGIVCQLHGRSSTRTCPPRKVDRLECRDWVRALVTSGIAIAFGDRGSGGRGQALITVCRSVPGVTTEAHHVAQRSPPGRVSSQRSMSTSLKYLA